MLKWRSRKYRVSCCFVHWSQGTSVRKANIVSFSVLTLAEGPDLPEERRRGHPDMPFLLVRAQQFEVRAFLEVTPRRQLCTVLRHPCLANFCYPKLKSPFLCAHRLVSLFHTFALVWCSHLLPQRSSSAGCWAAAAAAVTLAGIRRLVRRSPMKGSFYSF